MKILFIPAKSKAKVNSRRILELSKNLPKKIAIVYSIQFKDIALEVKEILSKTNNIVLFTQILGCSKPKINAEAILLIGSGKFHAVSLAYETNLPVFVLQKDSLEQISKSDLEIIEKKNKSAYLRYLNADKIGILVSAKPGQNQLKKAMDFKKKTDKKSYLFLCNNINSNEFQNFQMDSWVNTACPRLDMDSSAIIDIDNLSQN
jgi:diphthamide biosynthesis enzyme Dph1/Dph2-like protein